MVQQLINIGTAADDGTGDKPRAVGAKLNANFSELFTSRGFPDTFKMWTHGDSKSILLGDKNQNSSGLVWALRAHAFDGFLIGSSGISGAAVTTASGQIGSDAAIANMTAPFLDGRANVLVFKGFTNNSTKTLKEDMAVFRKIHLAARNAGAILTVIIPCNPYGPATTTTAPKMVAINAALRAYAENNRDCWFVDSTPALVDFTSLEYEPLTSPGLVLGSDGVHEGVYGAYKEGMCIAREFIRRGVPRRTPDIALLSDQANRDQAETGNMLRLNGAQAATGNTAGMLVTGGAGVTGAANWTGVGDASNTYNRLTGTLNGTAAIDIQRVSNDYYNDLGFRTDTMMTRLVFSGSLTSDTFIDLSTYANMYTAFGNNSTVYVNQAGIRKQETIYRLNALTGAYAVLDPISNNPGGVAAPSAANFLPPVSMLIQARNLFNVAANATFGSYDSGNVGFRLYLRAGAISGSVDVFSTVARMQLENLPPAV